MGIAADIIILVTASLLGGVLARLAGQPLMLGYILAGLVVGPYAFGFIHDHEEVELLAEIGVALLLFALGLEFSLKDLRPVRAVALIGTPIQILLTGLMGWGLALGFGWSPEAALWFGGFISLSSTMVILKTLESQGWIGTLSSKVMIGILIVQDLAIVPLLILLPKLGDLRGGLPDLGLALVKTVGFLGLMYFFGTRVLPRIMRWVALGNSRELFLLSICTLGLGIGYGTYLFGLSFAFGAFVAGMLLSESEYGHQALVSILSLRDLFALLFFASIGMLLDIGFLQAHWQEVLLLAVCVMVGKGLLFFGIGTAFRYRNVVPLALGLGMFQVGELSFLLARAGVEVGALNGGDYARMLSVAILSMLLTPLLSKLTAPIYKRWRKRVKHAPFETINLPKQELEDHVVVLGGGRIGSFLERSLTRLGFTCIVVEASYARARVLMERGVPVIWGDGTQGVVQEAAGVSRARLLLSTLPGYEASITVMQEARLHNVDLPVVTRAGGVEQMQALYDHGASEVILPEHEAGIEFARYALRRMGMPLAAIQCFTDRVHREVGEMVHGTQKRAWDVPSVITLFDLHWERIVPGSVLEGSSLADEDVRSRTGVSVVGILRGQNVDTKPEGDAILEADQVLALLAGPEQLNQFRETYGTEPVEPAEAPLSC